MQLKTESGNPVQQLRSIRFCFTHPTAVSVSVAGTFNDWHPGSRSMQPAKNGDWMKVLILPVGIYEYCLVVDGSWIPDPLALEHVPNPFGGKNSILAVNRIQSPFVSAIQ